MSGFIFGCTLYYIDLFVCLNGEMEQDPMILAPHVLSLPFVLAKEYI